MADDEESWVFSDVKGSRILEKDTSFVKLKMDSEILKVKWKKIRLVIKYHILVSLKMKLMSLFILLDLKKELYFAWWSSSYRKHWIVSLEILDQKILLENVNSILQTHHYELQRAVFSNEELKRHQRDIELVNNEHSS